VGVKQWEKGVEATTRNVGEEGSIVGETCVGRRRRRKRNHHPQGQGMSISSLRGHGKKWTKKEKTATGESTSVGKGRAHPPGG